HFAAHGRRTAPRRFWDGALTRRSNSWSSRCGRQRRPRRQQIGFSVRFPFSGRGHKMKTKTWVTILGMPVACGFVLLAGCGGKKEETAEQPARSEERRVGKESRCRRGP